MTTIACSLTEMAADMRVTWAGRGNDDENTRLHTAHAIKIDRIGDTLVGTSGDYAAGVRFLDWLKAGGKGRRPKLDKDFRGLKLSKEGIFYVDGDDTTWMPIGTPYYAVGSGAHYALGALEMGADPKQAVKIAMEYDPYTGGKVTVIPLNKPASVARPEI